MGKQPEKSPSKSIGSLDSLLWPWAAMQSTIDSYFWWLDQGFGPIAEKLTWIISRRRLFAHIEAHCGGRPARVKAENLWKEYWPRWSQPQELRTDSKGRAAS